MSRPKVRVVFLGSGDAFHTRGMRSACYLVEGSSRFVVDFGPTAPYALTKEGYEPPEVNMIFITHFHGDHFLGVPMWILHHQILAATGTGLTVYGPKGVAERVMAVYGLAYPACAQSVGDLVRFREVIPGESFLVPDSDLRVESMPMEHNPESLGYRFTMDGKVMAFTGDTMWTPAIRSLAEGADLLVLDCTFYDEELPGHLSYAELSRHIASVKPRRLVLSHLGPRMRRFANRIPWPKARDGLTLEV